MHHKEIVEALSDTHRRMEHVLTLVRLQVDALQPGNDIAGCRFLKNAFGYMHNYPGLVHHPTEEIMFTRLVARAPEAQTLCTQLTEQHKDFGRQETTLMRHLRNLQSGEVSAYRHTKELGAAYCTAHAGHIRSEEVDLIPQAVKWLPEEDWREIGAHSRQMIDPLLEWHALKKYNNLYDYLMEANGHFDVH